MSASFVGRPGDSRYNVENVYKMENNRKTKGMVQVLWRSSSFKFPPVCVRGKSWNPAGRLKMAEFFKFYEFYKFFLLFFHFFFAILRFFRIFKKKKIFWIFFFPSAKRGPRRFLGSALKVDAERVPLRPLADEEGSSRSWRSGEDGRRTQPSDQWRRSARSPSGFLKICPPTWHCPLLPPSLTPRLHLNRIPR